MVAFNDGPVIEFRRESDPVHKPVLPTRSHDEDKPAGISPSLYFLLSMVIPGLGQFLLGLVFQAILFFLGAIGCWYMFYAMGADMYWPILIAHFGSAISAAAKAKGDEVLKDASHLFPSG
jgi:TM2 domain-containing membrane protein YozV